MRASADAGIRPSALADPRPEPDDTGPTRIAPGFRIVAERGVLAATALGGAGPIGAPTLTVATRGPVGLMLLGRLFYRNELCRRFDIPNGTATPASVALDLLLRAGARALGELEGEFCLVAWDGVERRVSAMRDPLGSFPLFWSSRPGRIALATCPHGGRDDRVPAGIRPDFLADYLTRPLFALSEPDGDACALAGVQRVAPGTLVTLQLVDGAVVRNRVWDWSERTVDPGTTDTRALAEEARNRLGRAVRERLDGTVAAHLSGGMDSTAVAALALRTRPSGEPIHGVSLVWDDVASLRGETRFVALARAALPGIVPHSVPADEVLSFDSFGGPFRFDEPYPGIVNVARDDAMLERAAGLGARTVLSGDGGDDVFDIPPLHIADAVRRGRWVDAWLESTRRARAQGTDVWGVVRDWGLAHVLPLAWQRRARAVAIGLPGVSDRSAIGPWIRADFARRHDLEGRSLLQARALFRSGSDPASSAALAAIRCKVGDPERWALAGPRGLWLSHPFLDPRLLGFGLGIRRRDFRQDPSVQKPILAGAMSGILPAEILERVGKAHLNQVYFRGLSRNRHRVEALVGDPAVEALGLFDTAALRRAVRQTAMSAAWTAQGLLQLNLALSLAHWLVVESRRGHPTSAAGSRIVEVPF